MWTRRQVAALIGAAGGSPLLSPGMAWGGPAGASRLVYIGSYRASPTPAAGQPQAKVATNGIYAARLDTTTGALTGLGMQVDPDRATWLVTHPTLPAIYSVADSGGGIRTESEVRAYAVDRTSGAIKEINRVGSGGRDATHISIDAPSRTLFAANHDSGDVTALPLRADGGVGPVAVGVKDEGTGPHPRQNRPQPHCVLVDASHRYLLTSDFGADRIFVRRFDPKTRDLTPAKIPSIASPPGTGPRHMVFHRNGRFLYMNTEVGSTVVAYRWDPREASLAPIQTVPLWPADYAGAVVKSSAELGISGDGRFLYVSLRGDQDSLVVYGVDQASGLLTEVQRISSQGHIPRSFAIDPSGRWMLVANEGSGAVAVFSIDRRTGRLTAAGQPLPVPTPVAFTFA